MPGTGTQDTRSMTYGRKGPKAQVKGSGYQEGGAPNKKASTGIGGLKPIKTATGYKHDAYANTAFHGAKAGNSAKKTQKMYGSTGQMGGDGPGKAKEGKFKKGYDRY